MCEYNETVSKYMEDKVVFWGIPKSSKVTKAENDSEDFNITSEIVVLENYGQKLTEIVSIESSPEDGGMCGFQPRVGIPQLITAYPSKKGLWGFSTCSCEMPTKQLFDYLENGSDSFIPNPRTCKKDAKSKGCDVWEDMEENEDILWSKTLNYFPYSKHTKTLFSGNQK